MASAVGAHRAGSLGRASDAQLTSLVRRGDQDAFSVLYARHRGLVNAVARASSSERSEDIAQEAWTSAYRALTGPGNAIEHAGPWLATITRNVARDRHRRDMRQPVVANDDIVAAAPAVGGVESALEGKYDLGRLLGALDELPEEQRLILHLREFGGLTYKQIAQQLGKPESTIEAALFRARRKMAKEFAELDSGRRCRVVQTQLRSDRKLSRVESMRLTRHLGRCASCERVARLEGADDLIPAPRLARIAGVVPLPAVVARMMAGGADAVSPLVARAAVAAVAIAAGTGAIVITQGGGDDPSPAGAAAAPAAAQVAPGPATSLTAAPHVVRTHRVAAARTRTGGGGGSSSVTVAPTGAASTPVAAAAPATSTGSAPRQTRASRPARRRPAATTPTQPAPATAAPATPAPAQPVAQAPAPAAPAVPAAGATQQPAQPVQQQAPAPAAQAPRPPVAQRPAAPSTGSGPSVTQTPTCLVASCRVGG